MAAGDHIKVRRKTLGIPTYWHHGIEVRGNKVVHYGDAHVLTKKKSDVVKSSMEDFLAGGTKVVVNSPKRDSVFIILSRVYSRLREKTNYNLIFNNCEHFATWAETGIYKSSQVRNVTAAGIAGLAVGVAGVYLKNKLTEDEIVKRIDLILNGSKSSL